MNQIRSFISINLPKKVKEKVKEVQEKLPEFIGKTTEINNLHLTLKFLGEIDEGKIEIVKERLRSIKFNKFITEGGNLGVFSEKFIRIVWLHLTNCKKLQKEVDEKLKNIFEKEERFMSHLTIARVKSCDKEKFLEELKKIEVPKIDFVIDKFYLMKSELSLEGPKYEVIEEYDLGKNQRLK
ncbi:RNA 2',3'-cyclic phosphodiesterase [Candidatus Woesearchaeota archaeon]|jgi:2'-5' RNA ligase|nr:RNA 2',3'-cyclic phosphodiesterase [Candidatus Woesearchaeota archaeon]